MMRFLLDRVRLAWAALRHGRPPVPAYVEAVEQLLTSPEAAAVRRALAKDHGTPKPLAMHAEAQQWAMTYLTGNGAAPPSWAVRFLIEWLVGEAKGRL